MKNRHTEMQEMEVKWELETRNWKWNWKKKWKSNLLAVVVPAGKIHVWLAFVPRPESQSSSHHQFLIACLASLASFPGLHCPQYFCIGK